MAVLHIDSSTWRRLLSGEPFEGRDDAVRHLAEPCEACEASLAGMAPGDALDGLVDAVLSQTSARPAPGNDVEFARIWRRVQGASPLQAGLAIAAALAVAVAGGLALRLLSHDRGARLPTADEEQGLKGAGQLTALGEVEVSFAIAQRDAMGSVRLDKGIPGHAYAATSDVLVRYRVNEPGYVAVVRASADGSTDVVVDSQAVTPGEHDVEVGGKPAGYPLRGLSGPQRFAVVLSRRALSALELRDLAARLARPGAPLRPSRADVSSASFEIEVQPGPSP